MIGYNSSSQAYALLSASIIILNNELHELDYIQTRYSVKCFLYAIRVLYI